MRKDLVMQSLTVEILMDCTQKIASSTDIFSYTLKYYGNFTFITQIVHSDAHLNPSEGIFSDKQLIIAEISNFQFAEILNTQEIWPQKVSNFSHVWDSLAQDCSA